MSQTLDRAVHEAEKFRASFVRRHCQSADDVMALAIAMMQQAEIIFVCMGGDDHAASQFYVRADEMAARRHDQAQQE